MTRLSIAAVLECRYLRQRHQVEQPRKAPSTRHTSRIERCMYCLHSKRNYTVAGQVGRYVLEGCNCPAFVPEIEP